MITLPDIPEAFPPPPTILPLQGGLQFKDAAPMICGVTDNGVCADDSRVLVRLNEATKIILDNLIPVGGMMVCNIPSLDGILICPPQMENIIEAHPLNPGTRVFGNGDITGSWYEVVNNSAYLDSASAMDNPLTDLGLNGDPSNPEDVRRIYFYPGLEPQDAVVQCTGAKRYIPLTNNEDYLIVQNVEALKCIILSIERYENNAIEQAQAYRKEGLDLLQAEVKKHILDPRNYMFRKAGYLEDISIYPQNSLGWIRGQIALDLPEALRMGKRDLTWSILQAERRIMERGTWKDTIVTLRANVVGGSIYFPANVEGVYALSLNGAPVPIRSQYFQYLENGPGDFPCHPMLVDEGDQKQPGFAAPRRKYKLVADCTEGTCISAVCKLRWVLKQPGDMMTIKNYEALRLMMTAKFMEENPQTLQLAPGNQQLAFDIMDKELRNYLGGIKHTVAIQTYGFGLSDVGRTL